MWRALKFIIATGLLVAAAIWVADHPGTVQLDWLGYRIETSMGVLVFAVALFAVLVAVVYRFWGYLRRAPGRVRDYWGARRRTKGYQALTKGMVAVAAGDGDEARKHARRADALLDEPPLTMLLSAQAAQLEGDERAAERFFRAMMENPETEFLGLRGLLAQSVKRGDREDALALARRAYRLKPDSEWVAAALFELQAQKGLWLEARNTSNQMASNKLLGRSESARREAVLALQQSREAEEAGDLDEVRRLLKLAHDRDGSLLPATVAYARRLADDGKTRKARQVIEKAWAEAPHPDLVDAYCKAAEAEDSLSRVRAVEALAKKNPEHPESRLAEVRANLDAKLWGEARKYLEALGAGSSGGRPSARVCRMMAEVEEAENGDLKRAREWLVRAQDAEPAPAWVCTSCGNAVPEWTPVCGNCLAFDSFQWGAPPRVLSLPVHGAEAPPPKVPAAVASGDTPLLEGTDATIERDRSKAAS